MACLADPLQITDEHHFIEGDHKEQYTKFPLPCPNKCAASSVPCENLEAHRKECSIEEVECLADCGKVLQRQHLTDHLENNCPRRKVACEYCQITEEHRFIEGEHKEQCPKFPLSCPNKCEVDSVLCEDMEAHRKEYPLEMVQCEYHNVGCEEVMIHKDLEKHKMGDHSSWAVSRLDIALEQINTLMIVVNQTALLQGHTFHASASGTSVVKAAKWSVKLTAMTAMIKSGNQVCPVIVKVAELSKKKER